MRWTFKKTAWSIVFSCLSMFVLGVADNIRGPLFPELISFFKLSNAEASSSFALASAASFVGNVTSVFLLKRVQINRLLTIAVVVMAFGTLLMGLSSTFFMYMTGAFALGLSIGFLGVSQNLIIAENTPIEKQTQILSGLHGIYGFSSLLAPLLASRSASIIESIAGYDLPMPLIDWRSAFFSTSVLALSVLLLLSLSKSESEFSTSEAESEQASIKSPIRVMIWFAGFFACYVGAEILISTRLALFMRTYYDMNLEKSSNFVTYFFIFLLLGRILFTIKKFKISLKQQLNLSLISSLIFILLGLKVHYFFLVLTGFSMAPFYPLAVAYIAEQTKNQKRRFLTFAMAVQSLCVIAMHLGVGYLTDIYGLLAALGVGIFLLSVSILCVNLHPKVS